MKVLLTVILLSVNEFVLANRDVASAFYTANLTPNIVPEAPTGFIKITYGKESVNLGNQIPPNETEDVPDVRYERQCGAYYTLIMLDLDAPDLGLFREFVHWLVVNIPGNRVHKGQVLGEYLMAAPAVGTGVHRYVFVLYKQNQSAITFEERFPITEEKTERRKFSLYKFSKKYNLEGPLSGNFFRSQAQRNSHDYECI